MPVHCRKFGKQESIKSKIKVVLQARGNHYQICNHYRILYLLSSSVCVHMFYFTSNWQTLLLITLDLTLIGQLIRRGMLLVSQPSMFLSVSSPWMITILPVRTIHRWWHQFLGLSAACYMASDWWFLRYQMSVDKCDRLGQVAKLRVWEPV